MPGSRRPLAPALSLFIAGRLVFNTAHRFVYPFLPVIARGLGVSQASAGILVSARWAAGLATPAVVASAGKGERRRRLLALGLALFAFGAIVTAFFGVFAGAMVGFILMGIAKPIFDVSAQAYIADRVPYHSRARYLGVFELTWAGGLLVGAPAAGWLIGWGGWETPFWFLGIAAVVVLLLLRTVLDADDSADADHRSVSPTLDWDASAVMFLLVVALFSGAAELVFVVFGSWLEDGFGLSLVALGGVATVIGVAEFTGEGATVLFTDRIGKRNAAAVGMLVAAGGFLLFGAAQGSLGLGMAALAVAFFGFEFSIVSSIPLATEVKPGARTRYLSWMIVAMAIGRSLGAIVGTPLSDLGGLWANAAVAAGANIVGVILLLTGVRESGHDQA